MTEKSSFLISKFPVDEGRAQALARELNMEKKIHDALIVVFRKLINKSNHDIMVMKKLEFDRFIAQCTTHDKSIFRRNDLFSIFSGGSSLLTFANWLKCVFLMEVSVPHNMMGPSGCLRVSLIFNFYDRGDKGYLDQQNIQELLQDLYRVEHPGNRVSIPSSSAKEFLAFANKPRVTLLEFYHHVRRQQLRGTSQILRINFGIPVCRDLARQAGIFLPSTKDIISEHNLVYSNPAAGALAGRHINDGRWAQNLLDIDGGGAEKSNSVNVSGDGDEGQVNLEINSGTFTSRLLKAGQAFLPFNVNDSNRMHSGRDRRTNMLKAPMISSPEAHDSEYMMQHNLGTIVGPSKLAAAVKFAAASSGPPQLNPNFEQNSSSQLKQPSSGMNGQTTSSSLSHRPMATIAIHSGNLKIIKGGSGLQSEDSNSQQYLTSNNYTPIDSNIPILNQTSKTSALFDLSEAMRAENENFSTNNSNQLAKSQINSVHQIPNDQSTGYAFLMNDIGYDNDKLVNHVSTSEISNLKNISLGTEHPNPPYFNQSAVYDNQISDNPPLVHFSARANSQEDIMTVKGFNNVTIPRTLLAQFEVWLENSFGARHARKLPDAERVRLFKAFNVHWTRIRLRAELEDQTKRWEEASGLVPRVETTSAHARDETPQRGDKGGVSLGAHRRVNTADLPSNILKALQPLRSRAKGKYKDGSGSKRRHHHRQRMRQQREDFQRQLDAHSGGSSAGSYGSEDSSLRDEDQTCSFDADGVGDELDGFRKKRIVKDTKSKNKRSHHHHHGHRGSNDNNLQHTSSKESLDIHSSKINLIDKTSCNQTSCATSNVYPSSSLNGINMMNSSSPVGGTKAVSSPASTVSTTTSSLNANPVSSTPFLNRSITNEYEDDDILHLPPIAEALDPFEEVDEDEFFYSSDSSVSDCSTVSSAGASLISETSSLSFGTDLSSSDYSDSSLMLTNDGDPYQNILLRAQQRKTGGGGLKSKTVSKEDDLLNYLHPVSRFSSSSSSSSSSSPLTHTDGDVVLRPHAMWQPARSEGQDEGDMRSEAELEVMGGSLQDIQGAEEKDMRLFMEDLGVVISGGDEDSMNKILDASKIKSSGAGNDSLNDASNDNGQKSGYCRMMINGKVTVVTKEFASKIREKRRVRKKQLDPTYISHHDHRHHSSSSDTSSLGSSSSESTDSSSFDSSSSSYRKRFGAANCSDDSSPENDVLIETAGLVHNARQKVVALRNLALADSARIRAPLFEAYIPSVADLLDTSSCSSCSSLYDDLLSDTDSSSIQEEDIQGVQVAEDRYVHSRHARMRLSHHKQREKRYQQIQQQETKKRILVARVVGAPPIQPSDQPSITPFNSLVPHLSKNNDPKLNSRSENIQTPMLATMIDRGGFHFSLTGAEDKSHATSSVSTSPQVLNRIVLASNSNDPSPNYVVGSLDVVDTNSNTNRMGSLANRTTRDDPLIKAVLAEQACKGLRARHLPPLLIPHDLDDGYDELHSSGFIISHNGMHQYFNQKSSRENDASVEEFNLNSHLPFNNHSVSSFSYTNSSTPPQHCNLSSRSILSNSSARQQSVSISKEKTKNGYDNNNSTKFKLGFFARLCGRSVPPETILSTRPISRPASASSARLSLSPSASSKSPASLIKNSSKLGSVAASTSPKHLIANNAVSPSMPQGNSHPSTLLAARFPAPVVINSVVSTSSMGMNITTSHTIHHLPSSSGTSKYDNQAVTSSFVTGSKGLDNVEDAGHQQTLSDVLLAQGISKLKHGGKIA